MNRLVLLRMQTGSVKSQHVDTGGHEPLIKVPKSQGGKVYIQYYCISVEDHYQSYDTPETAGDSVPHPGRYLVTQRSGLGNDKAVLRSETVRLCGVGVTDKKQHLRAANPN